MPMASIDMALALRLKKLASGLSVCIVLFLITLHLEWLTSLSKRDRSTIILKMNETSVTL